MQTVDSRILWLKRVLLLLPAAIVVPLGPRVGGIAVTLPDVLLVTSVLMLWLAGIRGVTRESILAFPAVLLWPLLFLLVVSASQLASGNLGAGATNILRLGEAWWLMVLATRVLDELEMDPDVVLRWVKWAGVLGAILAVAQPFLGFGLQGTVAGSEDLTRSAGVGHRGAFGGIMMTGAILAYGDIGRSSGGRLKLGNGVLLLVSLIGLAFTLTRTWFMATLFGMIVLGVARGGLRSAVKWGLAMGSALALWLWVAQIGVPGQLRDRPVGEAVVRYMELAYVLSGETEGTSLSARERKWRDGLEEFARRPLLGVGEGNLRLSVRAKAEEGLGNLDNQWLELLVKHGVLAFALAVGMIAALLAALTLKARRHPSWNSAGTATLAVILGWVIGGVFWAILTGYTTLLFGYICAMGLHLSRLGVAATDGRRVART